MKRGRPYPTDYERRRLVRIELAKRNLTISALARTLGMHQGTLSAVINGTRLSQKTETRIASFLGVPVEILFPVRTREDLEAMRGRYA